MPAVLQAGNEGAIDLQDVDLITAQIGERGVPGAEVVDRNMAAQTTQLRDSILKASFSFEEHGLGDLQTEANRWQLCCSERLGDLLDETGRSQLPCRDVHPHHERYVEGVETELHGLLARSVQYPAAQFDDGPGNFRLGDELVRWQQSAPRVLPAHECLGGDDRAGSRVVCGLIVQHHLFIGDGVAQRIGEFQTVAHSGTQRGVGPCDALNPRALGEMQGCRGITQQFVRCGFVPGDGSSDGDADSCGEPQLLAIEQERLVDGVEYALRERGELRRAWRPFETDCKLVGGHRSNRVAPAAKVQQPGAYFTHDSISQVVSPCVDDAGEAVESDAQQRHLVAGVSAAL